MTKKEIIERMRAFGLKGVREETGHFFIKPELLAEFVEHEINAEREACANLCEENCAGWVYLNGKQGPCLTEFPKDAGGRHDGMAYADAIRERSNDQGKRAAESGSGLGAELGAGD